MSERPTFRQRGRFLTIRITEAREREAFAIWERNQARYFSPETPYQPGENDWPWVGALGEMVFNEWLRPRARWLLEDPLHNPDFLIDNVIKVDCKTSKRQVPSRMQYTVGMPIRQLKNVTDYYFFFWYEYPRKTMWLIGGMDKKRFVADSQKLYAGARVHAGYTVREGNELANIKVGATLAPEEWRARVLNSQGK